MHWSVAYQGFGAFGYCMKELPAQVHRAYDVGAHVEVYQNLGCFREMHESCERDRPHRSSDRTPVDPEKYLFFGHASGPTRIAFALRELAAIGNCNPIHNPGHSAP